MSNEYDNRDDGQEELGGTEQARKETAMELLPRFALQQAIGAEGMQRLSNQPGLCVVVKVPEETWIDPIASELYRLGKFSCRVTAREKPRRKDDETPGSVARYLARGAKVFGVSTDPQTMLPEVLVASGDLTIEIASLSTTGVREVIQKITGEDVDIPFGLVEGLTFGAIATCLRQGSTGQECLVRLQAMAARQTRQAHPLVDAVAVDELIGYGDAKIWAQNLVHDLSLWRRGETSFETLEARVVLAGPPGTGKTTFAKSVAKSAGIPLFATSAAAWFLNGAGYLDSVIKQMDAVFAAARAEAPACILIDELDSVPNRATLSNRGRDWWLPVVTHLLTLLDGATDANRNLIIIGATNFADRLDEALVRPGRMSRLIRIEAPSEAEVTLILRQHLQSDLLEADLSSISTMLPGATGAEIAEIVKRARAHARRSSSSMTIEHLLAIIRPPETRSDEVLRRIAIHEAGHAVVSHVIGCGRLRSISLVQSGATGGAVTFEHKDVSPTRPDVERRVVQLLGGRAAEKILLGAIGLGSGGASDSDLGKATLMVASLHASQGLGETLAFRAGRDELCTLLQVDPRFVEVVENDLRRLHERAETIVGQHSDLIVTLASALIKERFLTNADFLRVVENLGGI